MSLLIKNNCIYNKIKLVFFGHEDPEANDNPKLKIN